MLNLWFLVTQFSLPTFSVSHKHQGTVSSYTIIGIAVSCHKGDKENILQFPFSTVYSLVYNRNIQKCKNPIKIVKLQSLR